MTAPYRTWIEVSPERIAANYEAVRRLVGPAVAVCAVVKADAYRHGAAVVARRLERQGARWFAVSSLEEGVALRESGVTARILVLAEGEPSRRPEYFEHNLTPIIHSLHDLAVFDRAVAARGVRAPYHLNIDTGMGRLGVLEPAQPIADAAAAARFAHLEGLMTHFAAAADFTSTRTEEQMAGFESVQQALAARGLAPPLLHLANSSAVAYGRRQSWRTLVRCGLALYGYVTAPPGAPEPELAVTPALAWKAALLLVKDVPAGTRLGYGGTYQTVAPTRIGVAAVGYADGLPYQFSGGGRFIAGGEWAPVRGAISMDVTTIDLNAAPDLRAGDTVTIVGAEGGLRQDARELAAAAGAIPYSVLCGIAARVSRLYVD